MIDVTDLLVASVDIHDLYMVEDDADESDEDDVAIVLIENDEITIVILDEDMIDTVEHIVVVAVVTQIDHLDAHIVVVYMKLVIIDDEDDELERLDHEAVEVLDLIDQVDEVDDIIVQYQQVILVVYDVDDADDETHLHDDLQVEIDDDEEEDEAEMDEIDVVVKIDLLLYDILQVVDMIYHDEVKLHLEVVHIIYSLLAELYVQDNIKSQTRCLTLFS